MKLEKKYLELTEKLYLIAILVVTLVVLLGCHNIIGTRPYYMYSPYILPKDKISILFVETGFFVVSIDGKSKWMKTHPPGGRMRWDFDVIEMLPGLHEISFRFQTYFEYAKEPFINTLNAEPGHIYAISSERTGMRINAWIKDVTTIPRYQKLVKYKDKKPKISNYKAFIYRGLAYNSEGKYNEAITDFSKAIEINAKDAWAFNLRGNAYKMKGQYDQAFSDYNKAIEIAPNYSNCYYNRGNIYKKIGQYENAISDYSKAIELNPKYAWAYNNRALTYTAQSQYDDAISDFNKAIEIDPIDPLYYINRADAHMSENNKDKACSDLKKACKLKKCEKYNSKKREGICK